MGTGGVGVGEVSGVAPFPGAVDFREVEVLVGTTGARTKDRAVFGLGGGLSAEMGWSVKGLTHSVEATFFAVGPETNFFVARAPTLFFVSLDLGRCLVKEDIVPNSSFRG